MKPLAALGSSMVGGFMKHSRGNAMLELEQGVGTTLRLYFRW
jgi:hypothetical protein